ncbi:Oidioi.mRNA.OKI2018_I69.PAR.g10024.t1.cds [Oikopleura dioica]|uniref:Oidioi.mRNA.OKI2018_I69.PAR.g10024.t1.cds n=1 Tax=Oikopleura dioica TaxID=34765 RepID=A0ABN7RNJ8_OIKDI|nr:Oidioi.mRNA.OKI2018_I69.PAR.g10024.t1.cds [Oikopleura dioica]
MLILDYLEYPVNLTMKVVNHRNSTFPAITICNQNRFQKSKLQGTPFEPLVRIDEALENDPSLKRRKRRFVELQEFSDFEENDSQLVSDLFVRNDKLNWTIILDEVPVDRVASLDSLISASKDQSERFGQSFEDFVISCEFDQAPCGRDDFLTFQHEQYGTCHTFNGHSMKRRSTSNIGTEYGLKLILFADESEYVGATSATVGVRFDIHQYGSISFPEEHGQNAPVGAATAVSLRANQISRTVLPWNKENCTNVYDSNDPEYDGHYTYRACQKGCLQRHLRDECGCVTSLFLKKNDPVCGLLDKTTLHYSTVKWPSSQYEGLLLSAISNSTAAAKIRNSTDLQSAVEDNLLRLSFTFDELNAKLIEESPKYDIWTLFANIGGTLGLYVGISFITLFEFLEVLADICLFTCCYRCSKD